MFANLSDENSFIYKVLRNYLSRIGFATAEMRYTTLMIVFVFLSYGLKAQLCDTMEKHFSGAVILREENKKDPPGATINGCLKLMNKQEMHVGPKLVDNLGKTERFFGREALSYWYIRNKDTIYYLNGGKNLLQHRWVFLERILNGPMELYNFTTRGTTNLLIYTTVEYKYYYLRKNGKWLNKKAITSNEGGKRKQLQKIFIDCIPALELIAKTSSLQLDDILPQLVTIYNSSCY